MVYHDLGNGYGFHEPPYTDAEKDAFEQRLLRGGDITVVHSRKRGRREPSPGYPAKTR